MNRVLTLLLTLTLAASVEVSARNASSLSVMVYNTHPLIGATPPQARVVFADEPVVVKAEFIYVTIPDEPSRPTSAAAPFSFPAGPWWKAVQWSLRDGNGEVELPIDRATIVSEDAGAQARSAQRGEVTLKPGETSPRVLLNLGYLPVGEYKLSAKFRGMTSQPDRFDVRSGSETPLIRRAYLRYQLTLPASYERSLELTTQLAELEPLNASLFEDLGDRALLYGTLAEADGYYARALKIIEQRRAALEKNATIHPSVAKAFEDEKRVILSLRDILPDYFANRTGLAIRANHASSGPEYLLIKRSTGDVLRRIR